MKAHSTLIALALTALPCACVIDGVPLPDETGDKGTPDLSTGNGVATIQQGIYATLTSGVTVVFGVPGAAQANATAVVLSGSAQAQAPTTSDGSFNVALVGTTGETIEVRIIVGGQEIAQATVAVPHVATQLAPDGAMLATTTTVPGAAAAAAGTRVNATTVHLSFPPGSFPDDASVAIADLDRGTTQTASAGPDGSLSTDVTALSGDTLYVITITATTATAPYVVTAP